MQPRGGLGVLFSPPGFNLVHSHCPRLCPYTIQRGFSCILPRGQRTSGKRAGWKWLYSWFENLLFCFMFVRAPGVFFADNFIESNVAFVSRPLETTNCHSPPHVIILAAPTPVLVAKSIHFFELVSIKGCHSTKDWSVRRSKYDKNHKTISRCCILFKVLLLCLFCIYYNFDHI